MPVVDSRPRAILSTVLTQDQAEIIRARAAAAERSVAAELRRAVKHYLSDPYSERGSR